MDMYFKGYRCLLVVHIVWALVFVEVTARLHKRNGYIYRQQQMQHQHDSYFEPSLQGHEDPSAPAHGPPAQHHNPNSHTKKHYSQSDSSSSSSSKNGYSIGSGLRSIAQGSADQAYSAVANQHAAAKQAAFIAKNTLAQAAAQAAATAQAALAGKQVILQELEQQSAEAQRALSRELEQLQSAKISAKLAHQTAQAAQHHVSVLTAAVNNAKSVAEQAEQTSNEVSNQLASQSTMVGQAKSRLEQVEEQVHQARVDYAATKEAAIKAASSAAAAQVNASKAAARATVGLHESTNQYEHGEKGPRSEDSDSNVEHVEGSAGGFTGPDDGPNDYSRSG